MPRALIDAPRWLLLAALVVAPWAYGGTRAWSVASLNALLGLMLLLWGIDLLVRRRPPSVHPVMGWSVAVILLLGWWMVFNAHSAFDGQRFQFVERTALLPQAPGSVARDVSMATMLRVSALLGTLLFVSDLSRRPMWRNRLWLTVCLTGVSIVAFGFVQKIAGEPFVDWEDAGTARTYFAMFRYHGNAGAYINLVWPLIAGKALFVFARSRSGSGAVKGLWLGAALICFAAAFINASKAAMVIALVLAVALGCWAVARHGREVIRHVRGSARTALVVVVAVLGLAAVIAVQVPWQRWEEMFEKSLHERNERLLVAGVCLRMMNDAGALGFGPGTWSMKFPFYTHHLGDEVAGIWRFAHQDYLQTVVEWGYAGAVPWLVIFAGGIGLCFRNARVQPSGDGGRTLLFTAALALCGIALHALVDFPLQISSLQLYTALCLGLGWGSARWMTKERSRVPLVSSE